MMVMTAKVDFKKVIIALAAAAGIIIALVAMFQGNQSAEPTTAPAVSNNDARVQFLADLGWQVNASPTETGQVRIPAEESEVFRRYNALQKSHGYDLTPYGGKTVMRYVYKVTNYPGATDPVYATLLVSKNQVIGGDITDTAPKGRIRGLQKRAELEEVPTPTAAPQSTVPQATE